MSSANHITMATVDEPITSDTKITLTIDHREGALKDIFKEQANYMNLALGDITIEVDTVPIVVIERKTIADLAASIKDGRYKNQKASLLEAFDTRRIYYIIEGHFDYFELDAIIHGISKKAIVSMVVNTMVRDNIKVMVTKNVHETASLIKGLFNRVKNNPEKFVHLVKSSDTDETVDMDDTRVVSKGKAGNGTMTKAECFEYQLCQIPDISRKTAQAIMKTYPTLRKLFEDVGALDEVEKLKVLKNICIQDSKGKDRRISERVIRNLIEYIF
jgi:crossover junction endonuclease MUS81